MSILCPVVEGLLIWVSRPFQSSKNSHFQNEAKSKTYLVQMSFVCMKIYNHFHINGLALSLALKQRLETTRKWFLAITIKNDV